MKNILFYAGLLFLTFSCKQNQENTAADYASFGSKITQENAINTTDLYEKYKTLKAGDTLDVKVASEIKAVCQKKGCWMTIPLPEEKEAFVKFKDYGFFVPKNASKSNAIINGKAFVSIESVDELKHYAKDAGKSQAAIDSIIAPETTYSFMADGVLIKN